MATSNPMADSERHRKTALVGGVKHIYMASIADFRPNNRRIDLDPSSFWTSSKMLRFCSYLVCEINSSKALLTPNLSQIGRFLKIWTWVQIFGHRQKCSDLAQIWCEQCF